MKKIIFSLVLVFTIFGVIIVIHEENKIERVYIMDK